MIHQYRLNGYNIVLDIASGSVHVVDEPAYQAIALLSQGLSKKEVTVRLLESKVGTEAELSACLEDIAELQAQGQLFSEDTYAGKAFDYKNRSTAVKALCLHVSHACNLDCEYCFAAQGKFHGQQALMSFETGNGPWTSW